MSVISLRRNGMSMGNFIGFSNHQQVSEFGLRHGGKRDAFIEAHQSRIARSGEPDKIDIGYLTDAVNPSWRKMPLVSQA